MSDHYLFFSDTSQQQFEEALDTAGIAHARTEVLGEVVTEGADDRDCAELARELGADCS